MKHVIRIAAALGLFMTSPAFAAGLEELYIYPTFQYFTWEEFKDDGSRILKESGPLFGAGAAVTVDLYKKSLVLKGKGELFGGVVDYDGQTQENSGNPAVSEIPVKTDTGYVGVKAEADLGWRFLMGNVSLEPFAGVGYRWWIRDIQSSTATDRNGNLVGVGGAQETWQSLYTRFGARVDYPISDEWKVFGEAGGKYPVLNRNTAEVSGVGDVTVRPGLEWSAFAETGFRYKRFRTTLFYEGFRFSRSPSVVGFDSVENRLVNVHQPKTDSDIFGLTVGVVF